jgi:hypothetical protein
MKANASAFDRVVACLFDPESARLYQETIARLDALDGAAPASAPDS